MPGSPTPTSRCTPPRACRAWTAKLGAPTSGPENLADSVDSRLGDLAGCRICADAFLLGVPQDFVDGVADAGQALVEDRARPALLLQAAAVEHTARVDHEVGRVDDSALGKEVGVRWFLELVVGAAGDHSAAERRNRTCVEDRAGRTWRQDVAFGGERRVG